MGLADEFESHLERVVEGFFSKAFRSHVEPAEIGRRLMREMEGGKTVSMAAVYVPNRYSVMLSPTDYERLEGLLPTLESEFVQLLRANADERRWRPAGALGVSFHPGDSMKEGRFEVEAESDAGFQPEPVEEQTRSVLRLIGSDPPRVWTLQSERMVIGRLDECDVVVDDPNASRRHAEITRREDGWWITDLGATNGTLVNGTLIKERRLRTGDVIRIGNAEIDYLEAGREG